MNTLKFYFVVSSVGIELFVNKCSVEIELFGNKWLFEELWNDFEEFEFTIDFSYRKKLLFEVDLFVCFVETLIVDLIDDYDYLEDFQQ